MLRSEINESVNNLIEAIQQCGIVEVFTSILKNESEADTEAALKSFSKFLEISNSYNAFENQLLQTFDLEKLKDTAFWASILKSGDSRSRESIEEVYSSIRFVLDHLPKILALTVKDTDKVSSTIKEGEEKGLEYVGLSVVVIEEQELSTAKRLILMFEAIQGLYEVVGRMKKSPNQDLIVSGCDSGNDKKFDFLGSADIIEGVKSIILSLWDRVVFYREDKTGEQLELIVKSLPVLGEINDLEKSSDVAREEAEILRRQVSSSVIKFSKAGVTIPEMEEFTRYDPRELMRPDRKFLTASNENEGFAEHQEPSGLTVVDGVEESDEEREFAEMEADEAREDAAEPEAAVEPELPDEEADSVEEEDPFEIEESTDLEDSDDLEEAGESEDVDELKEAADPETFVDLDDPDESEEAAEPEEAVEPELPDEPADSAEEEDPFEVEEPSEPEESSALEVQLDPNESEFPPEPEGEQPEIPDEMSNDIDDVFDRMTARYKEMKDKLASESKAADSGEKE